jgi:hypothetical protein
MAGAVNVNALERPSASLEKDTDQIYHDIGAIDGGGDLVRFGNVGGPRYDLAGIAKNLHKLGGLDIAAGNSDVGAGGGQLLNQMTAKKTRAAEHSEDTPFHEGYLPRVIRMYVYGTP